MKNILQEEDIQIVTTNIGNNLRELYIRIGLREQANKQQLDSVILGYNNLEDILKACFLAVEHNLDQVETVIQSLKDTEVSIQASCVNLIYKVTIESIDYLGLNIIKQVAKQITDINKEITSCQQCNPI